MEFEVTAKIKNDLSDWKEDFFVKCDSESDAEASIKDIVEHFNSTMKPGEQKRKLVEILSVEPSDDETEAYSMPY